jgi:hypothetical protein
MKNQCGSTTLAYCLHLKNCGALLHTFSTVTAVAFKDTTMFIVQTCPRELLRE